MELPSPTPETGEVRRFRYRRCRIIACGSYPATPPPEWSNRLARTLTLMATIGKAARRRQADLERARQQAATREREREAEITRLIEETGWAVAVQDATDPLAPAPVFGYTIGRSAKGQPELCAWGHHRDEVSDRLNLIGGILEAKNHLVEDGDLVTAPPLGVFQAVKVPAEVLGHLEYARKRYTFLRALRMKRLM